MKKTRAYLENIENLVKRTYNKGNRKLRIVDDKVYNPDSGEPLGYSWMYNDKDSGTEVYNVVCSELGPEFEYTKYRIYMHEIGHIYFHFGNNFHEELDHRVLEVLKTQRGSIIDLINKECGIDFAEDLVNRVLDDPALNHSLHNIAMDMEINSKILSDEDVEEMEKDITSLLPKLEEQKLQELKDSIDDETIKKEIEKRLSDLEKESKIKLMLPSRYGFDDCKSYPEYLIEIILHLDKFVKMLVSIAGGGNGDTSEVTDKDLKDALSGGSQSLTDLMRSLGMLDEDETSEDSDKASGEDGKDGENAKEGRRGHDTSNSGGFKGSEKKKLSDHRGIRHLDHRTPSRENADKARDLGDIEAGGGTGCGNSGGPDGIRQVRRLDPVDSAIDEVIKSTKSRVVKRKVTRDLIRNYNLGKNRSVIVPSIEAKNRIDTKPKIVYIIDISASMDTVLIDRILETIARKMKSINRGLRYDIITWSTRLGEHIKDIDPGKSIPKIRMGGGTSLAKALTYIKENYDPGITFIVCSDFEDYLQEWCNVLKTMDGYDGWGFCYGRRNYDQVWPRNFKVRNFNTSYTAGRVTW